MGAASTGPPNPPDARRRPGGAGAPLDLGARNVRGLDGSPNTPTLGDAPARPGRPSIWGCGTRGTSTAPCPAGGRLCRRLDDGVRANREQASVGVVERSLQIGELAEQGADGLGDGRLLLAYVLALAV